MCVYEWWAAGSPFDERYQRSNPGRPPYNGGRATLPLGGGAGREVNMELIARSLRRLSGLTKIEAEEVYFF